MVSSSPGWQSLMSLTSDGDDVTLTVEHVSNNTQVGEMALLGLVLVEF